MHKTNVLLVILCSLQVFAQNSFDTKISKTQKLLNSVETGKHIFRQDIKLVSDGLLVYTFHQEDLKGKGKEITYRFSLSDIDQNTVRSITNKDLIKVQLLVAGKQKLIQVISDGGDKITYTNELSFYAKNSNNGNDIEQSIKALIPEAVALEEKRLSLNSYDDHLKWLSENITDVELSSKQVVQKLEIDSKYKGHLSFNQSTNVKSKSISKAYEFNLATLNPNALEYKISGDELIISIATRRGIKSIKYIENGVQKSYTDAVKIYAKSIINGKDLAKVLKAIIPLAEKTFNNHKPTITSASEMISFLNKNISEITTSEETLAQSLTLSKNVTTYKLVETHPDKTIDCEYQFNFADINANNIDYGTSKDRLFVILPVKKSVKFIRNYKDNEIQNYINSTKLYFNTIEDAIIAKKVLQDLVKLFEEKVNAQSYKFSSIDSSISDIKKHLSKVIIGEDTYDVFLELTDSATNTLKLTTVFSNLKKSKETILEFSPKDINIKNIGIVVSGKRVWTELNTKHLEKIIKMYVDGEIKPYTYKAIIEVKGIESARTIVDIFKNIKQ
ncbi:hypothetical protein [Flavivirga jejuensis]|uniref:Uncharacterized protein n=1 Tax=Flavivirga jejuensis TaxID=870487 RepID=A0ABT8WNS5_9FLAO|nr:hypothetical protein [Flavivirga jejuensis]MDO5974812.1 hypothetical protein [Flavivirga jejuensis]